MKCLVLFGGLILAFCHVNASPLSQTDCENLDLEKTIPDLLKMAQVDQASHTTALAIFKCKFSDTRFEVRELDDIVHNYKRIPVHILKENSIRIANFNFLLEFLRLFGKAVKHFTIDFEKTPVASCKRIVRALRLHATSMAQLDLLGSRGSELSDVDTPFHSVRNVTVSGKWTKWGSNSLEFGKIFPSLRRLDIKTQGFSIERPQSIVQIYQNLEHLHISLAQGAEVQDGLFLESIVEELIKLNPTIQSLSLVYCTERFLKDVIAALPYLESLKLVELYEIGGLPYSGENIIMENVRNLEIVSVRASKAVLQKTTFPQLQELSLDLSPLNPDDLNLWMDFVGKHKEIVFLKVYGFVNNVHLIRFKNDLPELTNIIIKCDRRLTTEAIVQFVQQAKQLIIFDLRALINVNRYNSELGGQFTDEWRIEPFTKERRLRISRKM